MPSSVLPHQALLVLVALGSESRALGEQPALTQGVLLHSRASSQECLWEMCCLTRVRPCGFQNSFRGCSWLVKGHLKSSCTGRGDMNYTLHLQLAEHRLSPGCSLALNRQGCLAASSQIPAFIPKGQALQQGRSSSSCCSAFLPGQSPSATS